MWVLQRWYELYSAALLAFHDSIDLDYSDRSDVRDPYYPIDGGELASVSAENDMYILRNCCSSSACEICEHLHMRKRIWKQGNSLASKIEKLE